MQIEALNIVLADDDLDDQFLFKKAIEESNVNSNLLVFNNGKEIMDYLLNPSNTIPDLVAFKDAVTSSTLLPMDEMIPMPVMTTRRMGQLLYNLMSAL